jgi:hypothetical protein
VALSAQSQRAEIKVNRRRKILIGAGAGVLTLGLALGIAEARGPGWGDHMPMRGMGMMMMWDQIDENGDGKVMKPELDAFIAGNSQQADANGDGQLSREEFTTFLTAVTRPFQVRSFQFLDADGNGEISATELQRPADRFFAAHEREGALTPSAHRHGRGGNDDGPPRRTP